MFFEQKAAEQTEVSIVSSVLSASSCSISLQCRGFLATRPLTCPLPGVPGRGDKSLSPNALKVRRSPSPWGSAEVRFGCSLNLIHARDKDMGVLESATGHGMAIMIKYFV